MDWSFVHRTGELGLGGEMDDDISLLGQPVHQLRVAYVAVREAPQRVLALQHVLGKIFDRAGVCQNEKDSPVLGIFFTE